MEKKIRTIDDIAAWRLCCGCGACAAVCSRGAIRLVNYFDDGIRPVRLKNLCVACGECLAVCPGKEVLVRSQNTAQGNGAATAGGQPLPQVWEGYSCDPEIRLTGSSGGAITALALHCLEHEGVRRVVHVCSRPDIPWLNETCLSYGRADLLRGCGSRYSPASPCEVLNRCSVEDGPVVFVGKPCDIAALRNFQRLRPELKRSIGVAVSLFCAGTPSTVGTLSLIKKGGLSPDRVERMRYRGEGWPGTALAEQRNPEKRASFTYAECWGFLKKFRPFRCHLCPDGMGDCADIACGDPWYLSSSDQEPGRSLVIARTPAGAKIVESAMRSGAITLEQRTEEALTVAQKNLFTKRGAIAGRIAALRLLNLPRPAYRGFNLAQSWRGLTLRERAVSILGTMRRVWQRGYAHPESRYLQP
ncbi:MAG: Coenzyme F420 hydrogenase/dehydrogenase, beta subunit C-terminal domain [Chitinispirillaceae bacterium]|nr:Coenzyme F420 hydrogenase/dehydrogenase, beta subunit C-terminal domain [Chitinispirillaceae bacterium]